MSLYLNLRFVVATILLYGSTMLTYVTCTETSLQPNIVLIMADDLGIGDIGCYGNNTMRTPNIDNLAKDGVMLTHHIAAAPLCTPSRAAFMTGRYPIRSGMDNGHRVRVLLFTASSGGLPKNETTFAALLQKQGYATGIVGKWHLGVNCESRGDHCHHPLNHGFDFFYGIPFTNFHDCKPGERSAILADYQDKLCLVSQTLLVGLLMLLVLKWTGFTSTDWRTIVWLMAFCFLFFGAWYCVFGFVRLWNCLVMRNHEIVQQPSNGETLPTRMIEEALAFIERNQRKPFLILVSFLHVHTPFFTTKAFIGKSKHGAYGDNVEEMDWYVGQIVKAIDNVGLTNKTLIHFTSDHGGSVDSVGSNGEHDGGWNGIYRGKKGFAGWEGGIRVPGIFRWPGLLPSNKKIDEPTSLMDIYSTVVSLAGASLLQDRVIDGRDLMPLLKGDVQHSEHEFLFHYCGAALNAVRWHPKGSDTVWKAHFFTPKLESGACYQSEVCGCHGNYIINHDPPLLFDLSKDPSEMNPVSPHTEPLFHEIQKQIQKGVEEHRKTLTSVPLQLSWNNVLWKPWLQPCCGTFPFCWCDKDSNVSIVMQEDNQ
ncbi:arylsulfatase H-like isoform X1 [Hemiscyllium ocellatum]|uniref:arylsulfatase H-like isoform X1 n=2 Tax=Hemiscyllium ocellatum TaxID=170820 RepID=UPI0029676313|nr:arylsulfatase H-like isoform X1 [Hemiscyllium ocellatum]